MHTNVFISNLLFIILAIIINKLSINIKTLVVVSKLTENIVTH